MFSFRRLQKFLNFSQPLFDDALAKRRDNFFFLPASDVIKLHILRDGQPVKLRNHQCWNNIINLANTKTFNVSQENAILMEKVFASPVTDITTFLFYSNITVFLRNAQKTSVPCPWNTYISNFRSAEIMDNVINLDFDDESDYDASYFPALEGLISKDDVINFNYCPSMSFYEIDDTTCRRNSEFFTRQIYRQCHEQGYSYTKHMNLIYKNRHCLECIKGPQTSYIEALIPEDKYFKAGDILVDYERRNTGLSNLLRLTVSNAKIELSGALKLESSPLEG